MRKISPESTALVILKSVLFGKGYKVLLGDDRRISLINSVVCIIGVFYFIVLFFFKSLDVYHAGSWLCMYAIISTSLLFYLNYNGKIKSVRILWLLNAMVIVMSMHATLFLTSVYFHYITLAVAGIILFGYKHRILAIALAGLSLSLFFASSMYVSNFYSYDQIIKSITLFEFQLNFIFCFLACVTIIYLHIKEHHFSKIIVAEEKSNNTKLLEQLRYSAKKYELISKASGGMFLELNLDSNDVVIDESLFNFANIQTTSANAGELLETVHKDDRDFLLSKLRSISEEGIINTSITFRMKSRSGTFHWLTATLALFEEGSSRILFVSMVDVNDKKLAEERILIQNSQLIKVNEELDNFVYHTSHDIRSPVCTILGLTHLAEKVSDPEELKMYLRMIEERASALERFIKNVMSYSNNSRSELCLEELNIQELVDQICSSTDIYVPAKSTPVNISLQISTNRPFISDRARIQIILKQLILNSITFSNADQKRCFTRIFFSATSEHYILKVEDNGMGIESSRLNLIFDMFYRASEHAKGSGIGLYIVKDIVSRLKGEIDVNSVLGKGTSVVVRLPIVAKIYDHRDQWERHRENDVFMKINGDEKSRYVSSA